MSLNDAKPDLPDRRQELGSFIRWLCSGDAGATLPDVEQWQLYLQFAIAQRIVGRTLARLLDHEPSDERWQKLLASLAQAHARIMKTQQRADEVAQRLLGGMQDVSSEYVLVKGSAIFELTRNPFLLRNSADRDVLLPESHRALSLLQRLGSEEYKSPAPHEEVNLVHEGVHFDFHKHFPIYLRSGGAYATDGSYGPTRVDSRSDTRISALPYAEIVAHSVARTTLDGVTLWVPGPSMSAVIQIAHLYRDLIRLYVPHLALRPRVRLQEILDIRDFVRDRAFSPASFLALVERHGMRDQARIVGSLIHALCEDTSLLDVLGVKSLFGGPGSTARLTLDLWNGFSADVALCAEDLMLTPIGASSVVAHLPSNPLRTTSHAASRFRLEDERTVVHTRGPITHFEADILRSEAHASITLRYRAEARRPGDLRVLLSWGDRIYHVNLSAQEERLRYPFSTAKSPITESHAVEGDMHRVTLDLPLPSLAPSHALVALGTVLEDGTLESGVLLPLRLVPPTQ